MEDDRASAASTLSEADSLADESQNARYGIHVSLSATRDGDGGGVPARVKTTNYDPALLRQLQVGRVLKRRFGRFLLTVHRVLDSTMHQG